MQKEIVINVTEAETRVSLLENGILAEFYIEQKTRRNCTGNIYKGKVNKVLPGMQAAFVDIGLSKDAFLYVTDFFDHLEEYEQKLADEETPIFDLPIDEPYLAAKRSRPRKRGDKSNNTSIESLLTEGQEVMVQVAKEPIGTKGARLTSHISLPGRYLVYMPTVEHIGVSRRIAAAGERQRLKDLLKRLRPPDCGGFIVRTAAEGQGAKQIEADIQFLLNLWNSIQKRKENTTAPTILHSDLDLICKIIRDVFTDNVTRLLVDSEEEYQRCLEFVDAALPNLTHKIKLYLKEKPIFDYFNIEAQLEKALKRKVWLKSGGYIIIEETEALVAIDVNTGKYVGKKNLEETVLKTNLDAIREIVRQVRLRDLGGIIVIDFIDMEKEDHRRKVIESFQEQLKADRTRTNVQQLSELGLVEMTRKRIRQSLGRILTKTCPYCHGDGRIKSELTVYHVLLRELSRMSGRLIGDEVLIRVHPNLARLLLENRSRRLSHMEKLYQKKFTVQADENLHEIEFNLSAF